MKSFICSSLIVCLCNLVQAQEEINYPAVQFGPKDITANWVTHPGISGGEDVAVLFRNVFEVSEPEEDFIINISADNHYFLYVNEVLVTHGPQLSDIQHWKYETLNLKNYVVEGKNVIAIKVLNYGKRRFLGMQSIFTSLMVNACTDNAAIVTTKGEEDNWRCAIDSSYKAIEVHWRGGGEQSIIGGFYANNPTDFVDMNLYPSGWKKSHYNDDNWSKPVFFEGASSMGGSIAYLLEPRNLPLLTWEEEKQAGTIVRATNIERATFHSDEPIVIEPHSKVSFLLDWSFITNGYPMLRFGQGENAEIKIKYAENLFASDKSKGDRNAIAGKELLGYYDFIVSNGNADQSFVPNWMRTFRFVEFEIETFSEALEISEFVNHRSRTAIPSTATFVTDNERYNQIFEICKRTVDICTQDYFLSDAYYETMQYVGDTKVHSLVWQALSGNLDHTKNALIQFDQSRDANGNILGAYPLRSTFIYPTYSLSWVDQIANYFKLSGDTSLVQDLHSGIVHTLYGFEKNMSPNSLVDKTPYRYFVDWYSTPNDGGGTATKNDGLHSAVVSLHYVFALQNASYLMEVLGDSLHAGMFKNRAREVSRAVYENCFDSDKEIFAERPDKTIYDQHTNIMAILTDAIPEEKQKSLLREIIENEDLLQASYYYRYYLFEAIKKVDAPELFDQAQQPWESMVEQNMTTTLERFESVTRPTRSEVHPWSSSPAYFYLTYLAGITSAENNYKRIHVKPRFGILTRMEGQMPTPQGDIHFYFNKGEQVLSVKIQLPPGSQGGIEWQNEIYELTEGENNFEFTP